MPFFPLSSHPLHSEAKEIIALVKSCGATHATIAGGFVRDHLCNKPIADIDVFYQGDLDEEKVKACFITGTTYLHTYDGGEFHVTHKELYLPDLTLPIQLIKVSPITSLSTFFLTSFGCDLSKCWIEKNSFYYTPKCYLDFVNKKLAFSDDCSTGYRCKMITKFKNFSYELKTSPITYSNTLIGGPFTNMVVSFPEPVPVYKPEIRILNR